MLFVGFFLSVFLFLYGFFVWRNEKKISIQNRISTVFYSEKQETEYEENVLKKQSLSLTKRLLSPLWKKIKGNTQKHLTNEKLEKIDTKLLQAGSPLGITAGDFKLLQTVLLIILPVMFGGYIYILDSTNNGLFISFILLGFICGGYVPSLYLKIKSQTRNKLVTKELPDFLDLVTVSIEAGLGFDSALTKVVEKKDGILSGEFQRCLEEMRLGKTRREALSGVRKRIANSDISSLIGSILQSEQLGIGMVQTLRVQSVEIRQKRKQRAEEQAMKAPIKMLFPLVIFIFPCIFIVILAPAVLQFLKEF
jgi:tight adherence protein C